MRNSTIYFDARDDILVYSERWEKTIRSTSVHYKKKGGAISFWGLSIGWRMLTLYAQSLVQWNYEDREEPMSQGDRMRVLDELRALLITQGYVVKLR
jgi:hypothetical protein